MVPSDTVVTLSSTAGRRWARRAGSGHRSLGLGSEYSDDLFTLIKADFGKVEYFSLRACFPFGDALELTVLTCFVSRFVLVEQRAPGTRCAGRAGPSFRRQLRVVPVATAISPASGMAPGSAEPRGLDASPEQTVPWSWGGPATWAHGATPSPAREGHRGSADTSVTASRSDCWKILESLTFVLHMFFWECYLNLLTCRRNERWVEEKSDKCPCPVILAGRRGADTVRNAGGLRVLRSRPAAAACTARWVTRRAAPSGELRCGRASHVRAVSHCVFDIL